MRMKTACPNRQTNSAQWQFLSRTTKLACMGDCRRVATIKPSLPHAAYLPQTQSGLLKNNYYTSKLLTSQQLSGVGGENRTHFHGFAIQCLSNWLHLHLSLARHGGIEPPFWLQKNHVLSVERMPYWYEWRDLNPQSIKRQILSLMCIPFHHTRINSIIHQTILHVNWYLE